MYLLHNDLLYKEDCGLLADPNTGTHLIKYHDLCQMNKTQIADRLRSARYVILGGSGFSGYNMEFNADNGIYRMTVDRTTEIKESKIFEDLYLSLIHISPASPKAVPGTQATFCSFNSCSQNSSLVKPVERISGKI